MKKSLLLFITFLTVTLAGAQGIGDTFTDSDIDYKITNDSPFEVEVIGSSLVTAIVPSSVNEPIGSTPCSVTRVGDEAFNPNTTLTSLELPSTVTSIGNSPFRNSVVETVTFTTTNGIITIDNRGFILSNISGDITSIISSAESIGNGGFNGSANITAVTTPSTLTTLGTSVFRNSGILTADLSASTSITELPSQTFRDCSLLNSVVIQSSVTSIGASAFINCGALNSVQVNNPVPATVGANAFTGVVLGDATLIVPAGKTGDYAAAAIWEDFGTITDGTVTLSTNKLEQALSLKLYPNPTSGIVNIKNNNTNLKVTVYDINGRSLLKTANSRIDISNYAAGVYVFKVETSNGQLVKRVLKN
ncbi:leucine-rich repeat protein [Algibacter amylolyticus]|uniref:Leucine-rich repeat protein n=1 Tax=Algibacter amylolyticus TaxID=1608400 RepID=A0A5M7BDK7_9FLAO|nr:leucine-rich repeat protein [Algibacter amylolyticus]KAA5825215.1 leucine-rich repeat protein [Algibacter amylolyticus]MBB5268663.1 hypothetical protein [Algibacter amylolyticus]TSJ77709.1 leucine-rich repeat protein [Algibacter amylolyticus]